MEMKCQILSLSRFRLSCELRCTYWHLDKRGNSKARRGECKQGVGNEVNSLKQSSDNTEGSKVSDLIRTCKIQGAQQLQESKGQEEENKERGRGRKKRAAEDQVRDDGEQRETTRGEERCCWGGDKAVWVE